MDKSIADIMKISIEEIFSRNIYKPICLSFTITLFCIALIGSFIHPSHKYLVYTSYIPDTIPSTRNTSVLTKGKITDVKEFIFQWRSQSIDVSLTDCQAGVNAKKEG